MGGVLDIINVLLMNIRKGLLRIATKEKLSRGMVGGSHQYGKKKVVFKQLTTNLEVIQYKYHNTQHLIVLMKNLI